MKFSRLVLPDFCCW